MSKKHKKQYKEVNKEKQKTSIQEGDNIKIDEKDKELSKSEENSPVKEADKKEETESEENSPVKEADEKEKTKSEENSPVKEADENEKTESEENSPAKEADEKEKTKSEENQQKEQIDEESEAVEEKVKKRKKINVKGTAIMLLSTLLMLALAGGIGVILAFRTYNGGPEKYGQRFFELYKNKNWYTMYDYSEVTETDFITRSQFAQAMENLYSEGEISDYTITLDEENDNYAYLTVKYTVETEPKENDTEKTDKEKADKEDTEKKSDEEKTDKEKADKEKTEKKSDEEKTDKEDTEEKTDKEKTEKKSDEEKTDKEDTEEKTDKEKTDKEDTEKKSDEEKTDKEDTEEKTDKEKTDKEDTEEKTTKKKAKKENEETTKKEEKKETEEETTTSGNIQTKTMKIKLKRQAEKTGLFFSKWKVCLDEYIIPESRIVVPSAVTTTFDGIDISGYIVSEDEENGTKEYLLGKIFEGMHIIEMECNASMPITTSVKWNRENSEYIADSSDFKISAEKKKKMYETARDVVVNYYVEAMADTNGKSVLKFMKDDDESASLVKKQLKSLKSEINKDNGAIMTSMDITSYTCKLKSLDLSGKAAVSVTYKCKYDAMTAINSVNEVRRIYNGENKATATIYFELSDGEWKVTNSKVKCVDFSVETEYEG